MLRYTPFGIFTVGVREGMPIPALNGFGLLPSGVHDCDVNEVKRYFCNNVERESVWNAFEGFLGWVAKMPGPVTLFVDGSFVTDKVAPNDVDVAVDISACSHAGQNDWILEFYRKQAQIKADYRTDFYPLIVGLGSDFRAFFQYVRVEEALVRGLPDGSLKGILRLVE